jgi:hypothetical protein
MFKPAGVVSWGLWGVVGGGCGSLGKLLIQFLTEGPGKAYRRR